VAFPDDGAAKRFAHEFTGLDVEIVTCGKVRDGDERKVTIALTATLTATLIFVLTLSLTLTLTLTLILILILRLVLILILTLLHCTVGDDSRGEPSEQNHHHRRRFGAKRWDPLRVRASLKGGGRVLGVGILRARSLPEGGVEEVSDQMHSNPNLS